MQCLILEAYELINIIKKFYYLAETEELNEF